MKKIVLFTIILVACCSFAVAQNTYKFDFGSSPKVGFIAVGNDVYSEEKGYGIDFGTLARQTSTGLTSDQPFYFSVKLPEGNYKVTVVLGNGEENAETFIKAESRRLFVEDIKTDAGIFTTKEFVVNVRTPKINDEQSIRLNEREYGKLDWDDKLTIEFNGKHPAVASIVVEKVQVPTVFLTGDSTVVDQDEEPWNSWGQMLTNFFDTNIAIANYAESGQALSSSISSRRLAKVQSLIKPGDYLFIQFGHNDMKQKGEGKGPWESYTEELKIYVKAARDKGATPVLITSMHRRTFDNDGKVTNSLRDYPAAVRKVAQEEDVALIDLNQMSAVFYEALGKEGSKVAFQDRTHHNNYGSYQLAKMIVEGIKSANLEIAKYIINDYIPYDPSHPDDPDAFYMPASPRSSNVKPLGD